MGTPPGAQNPLKQEFLVNRHRDRRARQSPPARAAPLARGERTQQLNPSARGTIAANAHAMPRATADAHFAPQTAATKQEVKYLKSKVIFSSFCFGVLAFF